MHPDPPHPHRRRDIIFGNETEAEAFSKACNFGTTDLKEIATKIAALPKVRVGNVWGGGERRGRERSFRRC